MPQVTYVAPVVQVRETEIESLPALGGRKIVLQELALSDAALFGD